MEMVQTIVSIAVSAFPEITPLSEGKASETPFPHWKSKMTLSNPPDPSDHYGAFVEKLLRILVDPTPGLPSEKPVMRQRLMDRRAQIEETINLFPSHQRAWTLAVRRGEFVQEACARMAEGEHGEPTPLSEAIRSLDVGEDVRVIPDFSRDVHL
jgi:hypothetical protein